MTLSTIDITSKMTANSFRNKIRKELDFELDMSETIQECRSFSLATKPLSKEMADALTTILAMILNEGSGVDEIEFKNQTIIDRERVVIVSHLKKLNRNLGKTALDGLTPDAVIHAVTNRHASNITSSNLTAYEKELLISIFDKRGQKIYFKNRDDGESGYFIFSKFAEEEKIENNIRSLSENSLDYIVYDALSLSNTPFKYVANIHRMCHIPVEKAVYLNDQNDAKLIRIMMKNALKEFGFKLRSACSDNELNECFETLSMVCGDWDEREEIAHYLIANHHFGKLEDQYPTLRREELIEGLLDLSVNISNWDRKRLDEKQMEVKIRLQSII